MVNLIPLTVFGNSFLTLGINIFSSSSVVGLLGRTATIAGVGRGFKEVFVRASEVISRLQFLQKEHGDMEVYLDVNEDGLLLIGEIDVDAEDTGIIIWKREASV